ncbi:S9 family peptidase [Alkalihalobacillus sp. FSL R5-0424]
MITFDHPEARQFYELIEFGIFAVSPEEDQVIFSANLSGEFELWGMNTDSRFPYKLTSVGQSCYDLMYSKDGSFIIASFDHDGDENTQIYALPRNGGVLKPLVKKEGQRHMLSGLSEDGTTLFYNTTDENETYLNTNAYHLETGEVKVLHEGEVAPTFLAAKNADGSKLVVGRMFANSHSVPYLLDGNELIPLVDQPELSYTFGKVAFLNDTFIYFTTNYQADFYYLASYDIETKEMKKVAEVERTELRSIKLDRDQGILYVSATIGVMDKLYQYVIEEQELTELTIPVTSISKVVISEKGTLYLSGGTATSPVNLYVYKKGQEWDALTQIQVPGIAHDQLSEPEVLTYKSFDGLEIETLYFKARPEVDNKHLILWPHGGPQASEGKFFRAMFQHLVYSGYNIVAPNFRGSSDYGAAFLKMVEGDWGYGPRLDNIACVDYMIEQGYVDKDKVLLMGGSYGGYMALLLHGRHPDYFKAVVDIFGVSNLFSFYESVPEFWKPIMKIWIGDPVEDKERFTRDSPITYLSTMTKPMLVIQGANDPRVVKAESDQIVEALKAQGTEVEYLVFEDEGHGFSKKANQITVSERVLAFFDQYI